MPSEFIKIKPSEICLFAEDGGRTLIRAGQYELKDGIKNQTRSYFLLYHQTKEVFLIPQQEAMAIFHPFSLYPDFREAETAMSQLFDRIKENLQ